MVQSKLQPKVNLKKLEIFSCPKCRFLSPDKQSLKRHMETSHSNEKSFSSKTSRSSESSHIGESSQRNGQSKHRVETSHNDENEVEIKSESDDNEGKNCCKKKKYSEIKKYR
jgi:hypothetical protein